MLQWFVNYTTQNKYIYINPQATLYINMVWYWRKIEIWLWNVLNYQNMTDWAFHIYIRDVTFKFKNVFQFVVLIHTNNREKEGSVSLRHTGNI
jgi:hypothetical protein